MLAYIFTIVFWAVVVCAFVSEFRGAIFSYFIVGGVFLEAFASSSALLGFTWGFLFREGRAQAVPVRGPHLQCSTDRGFFFDYVFIYVFRRPGWTPLG